MYINRRLSEFVDVCKFGVSRGSALGTRLICNILTTSINIKMNKHYTDDTNISYQ